LDGCPWAPAHGLSLTTQVPLSARGDATGRIVAFANYQELDAGSETLSNVPNGHESVVCEVRCVVV